MTRAPDPDQVEVTLIGPGYGECIVTHVGNGRWIIIGSCVPGTTSQPAGLTYLRSLGVHCEQAVDLVIATHWHDDHIRGLAELLLACEKAQFCCSSALGAEEFIAMVSAYDGKLFSESSSGVREIHEVLRILRRRDCPSIKAIGDRPVLSISPEQSGHGYRCLVTTLSPSDRQLDKFYEQVGALMPRVRCAKQRCSPSGPNHAAIVTWIDIGPVAILLGSDLEEGSHPEVGWSVIVKSATRLQGQASIFKVPHHGSLNGHNQDVWTRMLVPSPFAILTPYNRGSKLPLERDVERIESLTASAYSTANLKKSKAAKRDPAVERTLREAGVILYQAEPLTGMVRLRNAGLCGFDKWTIDLMNGGCRLSQIHS